MNDNVYVMDDKIRSIVKIGISFCPAKRLLSLQSEHKTKLVIAHQELITCGDGAVIESIAHSFLAPRRVRGEWFDVSPELAILAVKDAVEIRAQYLRIHDFGTEFSNGGKRRDIPEDRTELLKTFVSKCGLDINTFCSVFMIDNRGLIVRCENGDENIDVPGPLAVVAEIMMYAPELMPWIVQRRYNQNRRWDDLLREDARSRGRPVTIEPAPKPKRGRPRRSAAQKPAPAPAPEQEAQAETPVEVNQAPEDHPQ